MAKHLIVCGHGQSDPGALGCGTNERDFTRNKLKPLIEKWAKQLKSNTIEFYNTSLDMFQQTAAGRGSYGINGYASVTEFHLDAAGSTATGGHVIIAKGYNPGSDDLAIANVIKKYVGWWAGVKNTQGCNGRDNLLNLNIFAQRGINYRLVELGFIPNPSDMQKINDNLDSIAKEMVEAITGETIGATKSPAGQLDLANINTGAFYVTGKLKAEQNTVPFVFFLDSNGKELARAKGKWNGDKVEFGGNTPLNAIGKKFTLMFRASDDKGDKSIVEVAFPNAFELPLISDGYLDETKPVGGKLRLTGWHLSTKQQASDRHFLILMDKATNNELTRFPVTADSFKQSADVKQHYVDGRIAQAVNCRFDTTVDVDDKFDGKKTYIISRYCADPKGDRDIRDDKKYDDVLIFL